MTDGIILQISDDGKATLYESTYDITIHCDSEKEQHEVMERLNSMNWIPISERLPEEDTEVLISYRYKEGEGDTDHVNIDITSYGTTCFGGREIHTLKEWRQPFNYFHANYEVIAWMPLPTPYGGDECEAD